MNKYIIFGFIILLIIYVYMIMEPVNKNDGKTETMCNSEDFTSICPRSGELLDEHPL
jgi:putative Mn2+ efflux pump MntP